MLVWISRRPRPCPVIWRSIFAVLRASEIKHSPPGSQSVKSAQLSGKPLSQVCLCKSGASLSLTLRAAQRPFRGLGLGRVWRDEPWMLFSPTIWFVSVLKTQHGSWDDSERWKTNGVARGSKGLLLLPLMYFPASQPSLLLSSFN